MALGKIILSCGHEDKWRPVSGWPIYHKDFTTQGSDCINFSTFCLDCYIEFILDGPDKVFMSWDEAEEWLSGPKSKPSK